MFHHSSQQRHWTLTRKGLQDVLEKSAAAKGLSTTELQTLIRGASQSVRSLARDVEPRLPILVVTAGMYFVQRHLISPEPLKLPVRVSAMLALYTALKTEEVNIPLDHFSDRMSTAMPSSAKQTVMRLLPPAAQEALRRAAVKAPATDDIDDKTDLGPVFMELFKSYELDFVRSLHFHLVVHTPHRPLKGLLADLKTLPEHSKAPLQNLAEEAHAIVSDWTACSLIGLVHPPSKLALAALSCACERIDLDLTSFYLHLAERNTSDASASDMVDKLKNDVQEIQAQASDADKATQPADEAAVQKLEDKALAHQEPAPS